MLDCTDFDTTTILQERSCDLIRAALLRHPGRVAVVSSFGAESALLLALVARVDQATPVLFLETGQHFPETLAYRQTLACHLGLKDVRDIRQSPGDLKANDPDGELWAFDPDACCRLRKVAPLGRALGPYDAWVTGRKRHQSATRSAIPEIEAASGKDKEKVNPLAAWTSADVETAMDRLGLPRHVLVGHGYRSIGCAPCTRAVSAGEDSRSGRWAGARKTECGIHLTHDPAAAI